MYKMLCYKSRWKKPKPKSRLVKQKEKGVCVTKVGVAERKLEEVEAVSNLFAAKGDESVTQEVRDRKSV